MSRTMAKPTAVSHPATEKKAPVSAKRGESIHTQGIGTQIGHRQANTAQPDQARSHNEQVLFQREHRERVNATH